MLTIVKIALVGAVAVQALPANDLRARQNGRVIVTGFTVPQGSAVPTRKEIRTLTETELNIFLLGLEAIQQPSKATDPKSFYLIGGIHGTSWAYDGDSVFKPDGGFCTHADPAFPPWHRPYISLYEKTIHEAATAAINAWPAGQQKTDHQQTLQTWRLPYWDWAQDASLPDVMGGKDGSVSWPITRLQADGKTVAKETRPNPLVSFSFPKVDASEWRIQNTQGDPVHTDQSVRNPLAQTVSGKSGKYYRSRNAYTSSEMVEAGSSMKTSIDNMFKKATTYSAFSNMRSGSFNLEGVHGTVHITVGGYNKGEIAGHMTDPAKAGFDPIFYMHHCNVDRLFALWQAAYPNSYITGSGATAPLHPFRKSASTFWNSNDSRDVKAFGYTYPELQSNPTPQQMLAKANQLYGGSSPVRLIQDAAQQARKIKRDGFIAKRQDTGDNDNLHTPPSTDDLAQNVDKIVNGTAPAGNAATVYNEYTAKLSAPMNFAGGPGRVLLFVGEPESEDLTKDNNFVGSWDVFASSNMDDAHAAPIQGVVDLTTAFLNLVNNGRLADLKPKTVRALLKDHLVYRVAGANEGTQKAAVKINVVTSKVTVPAGENSIPTYGKEFHVYRAN